MALDSDAVFVGGQGAGGVRQREGDAVAGAGGRRNGPGHVCDLGEGVGGGAAGDVLLPERRAGSVADLPPDLQGGVGVVVVVDHEQVLAERRAGRLAGQRRPVHQYVDGVEGLLERVVGALGAPVVVDHRGGDGRPAVLELEEQGAVAGAELVAAVELGVVLEVERLVLLAVADELLQAVRLADPAAQDVAVQAVAGVGVPVGRPAVRRRDDPLQ